MLDKVRVDMILRGIIPSLRNQMSLILYADQFKVRNNGFDGKLLYHLFR